MAICSLTYQGNFVRSPEGIFKTIEIVIGFAIWGLLFIGDAFTTSHEAPDVNNAILILTMVSLSVWFITSVSYISFLFVAINKRILGLDTVVLGLCTLAYSVTTAVCSTSAKFNFLCVEKGVSTLETRCTSALPKKLLRNNGQNLALVVLSSVASGLYLTHLVHACTKLCTKKFIPKDLLEDHGESLPV